MVIVGLSAYRSRGAFAVNSQPNATGNLANTSHYAHRDMRFYRMRPHPIRGLVSGAPGETQRTSWLALTIPVPQKSTGVSCGGRNASVVYKIGRLTGLCGSEHRNRR